MSYDKYLFDPRNSKDQIYIHDQQPNTTLLAFDEECQKDYLQNQVSGIKSKLISMGFPPIGDLFSSSAKEVEATVKTYQQELISLMAVIQQRKNDLDFRNDNQEERSKLEQSRLQVTRQLETASNKIKTLETEIRTLTDKHKVYEKSFREQNLKLQGENTENQKAIVKAQNLKVQFEHEFKQKDLQIHKLKESIQKSQSYKGIPYKNNFEVLAQIEMDGPQLFAVNGEHEFSQLVMKRWEDINTKLQTENKNLRHVITQINNELNDVLVHRKNIYLKRRKIDFNDQEKTAELSDPLSQMHDLKSEMFNFSNDGHGSKAIKHLQENVNTFKDLMMKFDHQYELQLANEDTEMCLEDGSKIKVCQNLNQLFKNYNQIFEAQDKMISQIVTKSQGLQKIDDLNYNITRFNKVLEDKQVDEVKQYLEQQERELLQSKEEMDLIKRQFQQQLKRREEEKQIIAVIIYLYKMRQQELIDLNLKFEQNIKDLGILSNNQQYVQ